MPLEVDGAIKRPAPEDCALSVGANKLCCKFCARPALSAGNNVFMSGYCGAAVLGVNLSVVGDKDEPK